ncbi:MAG: hypothetical protein KC766_13530 [Myxococcales bacterium]|nr:hypothetical protein [Myxococcales bacterium]
MTAAWPLRDLRLTQLIARLNLMPSITVVFSIYWRKQNARQRPGEGLIGTRAFPLDATKQPAWRNYACEEAFGFLHDRWDRRCVLQRTRGEVDVDC